MHIFISLQWKSEAPVSPLPAKQLMSEGPVLLPVVFIIGASWALLYHTWSCRRLLLVHASKVFTSLTKLSVL